MGGCLSSNPPALGENSRNIVDCHICERIFDTERKLGDHFDDVHPEAKFKCQKCVRAYITKFDREAHMHQGDCSKKKLFCVLFLSIMFILVCLFYIIYVILMLCNV
jgi:hypothetical protein